MFFVLFFLNLRLFLSVHFVQPPFFSHVRNRGLIQIREENVQANKLVYFQSQIRESWLSVCRLDFMQMANVFPRTGVR